MRSRTPRFRLAQLTAAAAVSALAFAACGGSGNSSASGGTTTSGVAGASKTKVSTFPLLKLAWEPPDYFDPALAYTVESWQIMWNVYDGLLTYKHAPGGAGATLIPALAQSMPTVTNGGKVYKFTLRPNLTYSNGKSVKASDFACTIQRDYQMQSPGVGFFSAIKGADQYAKLTPARMKSGHIAGIATNDAARTVTITLTHPEADMMNILATLFTAFVPCGTPATDQSTHPTPATGPYMIQKYVPHQSFALVRNPHFNLPDVPRGNPDKVTATLTNDNSRAANLVAQNQADYDFLAIPTDRLGSYEKKYGSRIKIYTPANTYYLFLNQRTKPFGSLKARQAVEYAIDRNQFVQIFGGLAQPTQNFLPPTYKGIGYQKVNAYHYDLAKAKQLVKQSGTAGTQITVWSPNVEPDKSLMEYVQAQLNKIGWKAQLKLLDTQVYFQTIENQATHAQTGYVDWYQDYPNPIDWFDVLVNGQRITQTHNNNVGNVNDPVLNSMIDKLKSETKQPSAQAAQWAKIGHRLVVTDAAAAPYVNRSGTDFFSSRMDLGCYYNHVLYQWDFSTICVNSG
jgi:peptide/nickel transport system substrate-binding protein